MLSLGGALVAGGFGIILDQITYTISPEYFTRMKFDQFQAADFGFPLRVFVAEIGFLATWWVGLIGVWFLARVALRKFESPEEKVAATMLTILGTTLALATLGYLIGPHLLGNRPGWSESLISLGVTDSVSFNRVAGIHLGSYLGAFVGWLMTMAWLMISRAEP
jgi:hypothetical protein